MGFQCRKAGGARQKGLRRRDKKGKARTKRRKTTGWSAPLAMTLGFFTVVKMTFDKDTKQFVYTPMVNAIPHVYISPNKNLKKDIGDLFSDVKEDKKPKFWYSDSGKKENMMPLYTHVVETMTFTPHRRGLIMLDGPKIHRDHEAFIYGEKNYLRTKIFYANSTHIFQMCVLHFARSRVPTEKSVRIQK
jgi:hypothetical protein